MILHCARAPYDACHEHDRIASSIRSSRSVAKMRFAAEDAACRGCLQLQSVVSRNVLISVARNPCLTASVAILAFSDKFATLLCPTDLMKTMTIFTSFPSSFQARGPFRALGAAAGRGLPAQTSWPVTRGPTRARRTSSAPSATRGS